MGKGQDHGVSHDDVYMDCHGPAKTKVSCLTPKA